MTALNIALASVGYVFLLLVIVSLVLVVYTWGAHKFGEVKGSALAGVTLLIAAFLLVFTIFKLLGFE